MRLFRIPFLLVFVLSLMALAFSEEVYDVKIEFNKRIEMRDGMELSADIYRPDSEGRFPVILSRTPYNKNGSRTLEYGRHFASHGYVYIAMDVRGRGDSDGAFVPYRYDGIDGYDAIEWSAAQPWSTGKVGTIGGSYNARIQWFAAILQPPHLEAMITMVCPSDPFVEWPTGLPLPMGISWYHFTSGRVRQNMEAVDWEKLHKHLPIYTMDEAAGRPSRYWKKIVEHSKLDEFWEPLRYQNQYEKVMVPVYHISGWYDDELVGTPLNYIGMTTRGKTDEIKRHQKMLIGPWPHGLTRAGQKLGEIDLGPEAIIDWKETFLRWFDHWLKDIDNGIEKEPPVRLFVMGDNKWVDENEWPMKRTKWKKYYLHSDGKANSLYGNGALSMTEPGEEPPDEYTYDPKHPVPFITDPEFAQIGGPDDYRSVERRDDVLVYTSEPMKEDTTICGPISMKLYTSSSVTDTDFMGKLLDVWPNGFAQRLNDGMVRARFREGMDKPSLIKPGKVYLYDIDLWDTCQTFKKKHRIRVEVASSAFPKYDRNPNTGDPLGMNDKMQMAKQKIYHDSEHPSYILLPIIPEKKEQP